MIRVRLQRFAEEAAEAVDSKSAESKDTSSEAKNEAKTEEKEAPKKTYTDADIDRIIGRKFAEWKKAEEKRVSEAEKMAKMTATERAEHERDELQKRLNELERKNAIAEMSATARKMLAEDGVVVDDDLIAALVTGEAETTKAAVQSFSKAFREAVQKAVKDALKGSSPKTGTKSGLTKEAIMKVENRNERQRLIQENIGLFK